MMNFVLLLLLLQSQYGSAVEKRTVEENIISGTKVIKVWYIRHGKSKWNQNHGLNKVVKSAYPFSTKYYDAILNNQGIKDAHDAQKCITNDKIKNPILISSPLVRAAGTLATAVIPTMKTNNQTPATIHIHRSLWETGDGPDCTLTNQSNYESQKNILASYVKEKTNGSGIEFQIETREFGKNKRHKIGSNRKNWAKENLMCYACTNVNSSFALPEQKIQLLIKDLFDLSREHKSNNIIIGGHSLFMKEHFAAFAKKNAKTENDETEWSNHMDKKLNNGAVMQFDITYTKRMFEAGTYAFGTPSLCEKGNEIKIGF